MSAPEILSKHPTIFLDYSATGSRVIVSPMPEGRDEDWIVYVENLDAALALLRADGFKVEGCDKYGTSEFRSTRKNDLNLILTPYPLVFDRYVLATEVAKQLNLKNRYDRVKLFQVIREVGRFSVEEAITTARSAQHFYDNYDFGGY